MKNSCLTCMLVAVTGFVHAAVLTVDIAADAARDLTADEIAAVTGNTVTEVVKTGLGTLMPGSDAAFKNFKGTVRVQAGTLKLQGKNWIPTSAKIVVEGDASGGGTLLFYSTPATFNTETPIEFCGTGVGGTLGALRMEGPTSGDMDLANTKMTGDALVTSSSGRPFRFNGSSGLDMQGYTLTFNPSATPEMVLYTTVKNPGTFIIEKGSLRPGYGSGQTEGGRIILRGSAFLNLYKFGTKSVDYCPWTLETQWSGAVSAVKNIIQGGSTAGYVQQYAGNIVLNGGWTNTLHYGVGTSWKGIESARYLSGDISGEGSLSYASADGCLRLAGANTAEGSLIMSSGTLVLENPLAVPNEDPRNLKLSSAATVLMRPKGESFSRGFELADYYSLVGAMQSIYGNMGRELFLYPSGDEVNELPGTVTIDSEDLPSPTFPIRVKGGTVKMTASFANHPALWVENAEAMGDTAVLATPNGEGGEVMDIAVRKGTLKLENLGYVVFTNRLYVHGNDLPSPRLVVGTGSVLDQPCKTYSRGVPNDPVNYLDVGCSTSGRRGVVEVLSGGVLTNALRLATVSAADAIGSVYLRSGGSYFNTGRAGYDTSFPSDKCEAYLEIDGGTFETGSGFFLGGLAAGGLGVMYVKDGVFSVRNGHGPCIAREGTGVVYQCGGRIRAPEYLYVGNAFYRDAESFSSLRDGHAALTIDGTNAMTEISGQGDLYLSARWNLKGYLNLNDGGTLQAKRVSIPLVNTGKNGSHVLSDRVGYLGFDGGRLRATGDCATFLGGRNQTATYTRKPDGTKGSWTTIGDTVPNYVTVYSKGAILDSSNFTVKVVAPLVRPPLAGGVQTLSIPGGTNLVDYCAAPMVCITGDGQGATAVALFDSTNGVVTGVKVTSPGWGYTAGNTRAILYHGHAQTTGTPKSVELDVVLGDNTTTGGLVVDGSGVVELAATNTYGGATEVRGGTLKISCDKALPEGSRIVIGEGIVDMNGYSLPAGCAVEISNPEAYATRTKSVTLMKNVAGPVTVANASALPPLWSVANLDGAVKVCYNIGTLLIFR